MNKLICDGLMKIGIDYKESGYIILSIHADEQIQVKYHIGFGCINLLIHEDSGVSACRYTKIYVSQPTNTHGMESHEERCFH